MAVKEIAYKPELTKQQAEEIFRKHFEPKYKVEDFTGPFRDFTVTKNAFVGVALKLEQDAGDQKTKFVYGGLAPRWWARVLLGALIGVFLWQGLTKEVEAFIDSAPEFH
jgi:hypothetical protein